MKRTLLFSWLVASSFLVHCDAQLTDGVPCHALSRTWCNHLDGCGALPPGGDAAGCLDTLQASCSSSAGDSTPSDLSDVRSCLDALDGLACGEVLPGECSGLRTYLHCATAQDGVDTTQGVSYCPYVTADGAATPGASSPSPTADGKGGADTGTNDGAPTDEVKTFCDGFATWASKCQNDGTYANDYSNCLASSQTSSLLTNQALVQCYANARQGKCSSCPGQ